MIHHRLKPEHAVSFFVGFFLPGFRIMGIGMPAVKEPDNMEAAFVDVEMDVPRLKAWRAALPHLRIRIQPFHFLPGGISDSLAVGFRKNEQQFQFIVLGLLVVLQHKTAGKPSVFPDTVGDAMIDTVLDCLPGNDLAVFLKMIVAFPEFFHRTVFERAGFRI